MTTMRDVARLAGVSAATVSHVINDTKKLSPETTQRVQDAIKEAQYTPNTAAKALRRGKSFTIGVLCEDIRGISVPGIVNGISETLEAKGYQMIFSDLHLLEKLYNQYDQITNYRAHINRSIGLLLQSGVDGIIYVSMHDRPLENIVSPIPKPLVFAFTHASDVSFVTYNNRDAAAQVTRHLINKGHRKIALITGHPQSYPTRQRLAGFMQTMDTAGIPINKSYICQGDWELPSGERQTERLIQLATPPTAIFAMNDSMAIGCMRTLLRHGLRIPEDISVAGFDDKEIGACFYPELTTVKLPTEAIGRASAHMLFDMIGTLSPTPQSKVLGCRLIIRSSTSPRTK